MAIAPPTTSSGTAVSTTSFSMSSPSVSGSNVYGVVMLFSTAGDTITGVTWNGVACTFQKKQDGGVGIGWQYIYGIVAPASGVTTIAIASSSTSTINAAAHAYAGAQQTVTADSTNAAVQANGVSTSFSLSTTTVVNNAWVIGMLANSGSGSVSSITTGTQRVSILGQFTTADFGPKTPAGSQALAATWSTNVNSSIIMMSLAPFVPPDPQFDNATDFTLGMVTQSTWTFNHTVGTNANRVLFVGVSTFNSTTVSVTYNGVSMSSAVAGVTAVIGESSMWVLVNPPSGSNAVVVTTSAADNGIVIGAMSFYNANPTSPIDGTASNSSSSLGVPTASTTLTTSHSNTVALDWLLVWENPTNGTATVGTGQTELLNATVNCQPAGRWIIGASSSWQTPSPTMQWTGLATGTSRGWAQCVLGVRAFAPAVGGGSFLFNLM